MLSIYGILPEIILFVCILGVVLAEVGYHGERERLTTSISLLGNLAALIQVVLLYDSKFDRSFGSVYLVDGLALFFKFMVLTLGLLVHGMTIGKSKLPEAWRSEFYILLNGYLLGACLAVSSGDLFLIFCCIILMTFSGFFLASFSRDKKQGLEAGLKFIHGHMVYLVVFLMAVALLFNAHGTLSIHDLSEVLNKGLGRLDTACLALIYLVGMSLISCFPLSFWYTDVAEGAPIPSATVLSLGGACVGFPIILRIFYPLLVSVETSGAPGVISMDHNSWLMNLVVVVSASTMLFGGIQSLRQTSLSRILGYLALSQWGFLQLVFLVYSRGALSALLYGMFGQVFALVGCYWAYSLIRERLKHSIKAEGKGTTQNHFEMLRGSTSWATIETCLLVFFLFCLVGFPMTPVFLGKFAILAEAHAAKQHHIILVALLSTVFCGAACVRVAFHLLNGSDLGETILAPTPGKQARFHQMALLSLVLPMIALLIFPDWVLGWAAYSLSVILW